MRKLSYLALAASLWASTALAGNPYTSIGNANYSVLPSDIRLVPTVALTSNRTITLPYSGATAVGSGTIAPGGNPTTLATDRLEVIDLLGNVGGSNSCIVFTAQSGDLLNGVSGGSSSPWCNTFGRIVLRPMGGLGWTIDDFESVSSSVASGSAVSLTTNTAANVTSLALTPGTWDCRAVVGRVITGTTSFTLATGTISTTTTVTPSATTIAAGQTSYYSTAANVPGVTVGPTSVIPPVRFNLAAATTVYLGAYDTFTASTDAAYGNLTCARAL